MIRHLELIIDFDLTCGGYAEDFESDSPEGLKESIEDYIIHNPDELLNHLTLKNIWYEEEDE